MNFICVYHEGKCVSIVLDKTISTSLHVLVAKLKRLEFIYIYICKIKCYYRTSWMNFINSLYACIYRTKVFLAPTPLLHDPQQRGDFKVKVKK